MQRLWQTTSPEGFANAASRWLWPLHSEELCRAASRKTGLDDFGSPEIEPALSVLLKSLSEEADLHPLGRFLMRVHLLGLLQTRLKLAERWKADIQGLQAEAIQTPLFIIGMPRSGSTFLHELLAED